ncbi:proline-, glutamic acid- and leucine-rich protein 1-like [Maniola hyperantus]|uniref:proline-, glutamic acid- and leucine-rich protein 1-like n=1 Tax=Aphantopus hyperantus TaxID=2795564 RepID=UPI001569C2A8|nr:uncharacterized protein LOC117988335 [Maniola hyperantus]
MEQVLKKVHNVDPNNSEEIKEALSSFFQCLSKYKELHSHRLLRELQIVIDRFPKYCMSHRNNVETYLISFLSSNNYFNVIEAAKCAHSLQQVRPTQEKSATPKTSWRDQMSDLCNAVHTLIGSVYTEILFTVEVNRNNVKPLKPASTPMSTALADIARKLKNVTDKQLVLQLRLKNVLIFIQAMLVETYPTAKLVQPQTILDVIVRLLSVTSGAKQYDKDICTIKIQALRTLDALIVCLGSNLIPYSPLVFRLVLQTLRWSSDNPTDNTSKVRCTAYNSLGNWLTTLHSHRIPHAAHAWEDDLVHYVITDITPVKKVVQLTMGPQPTRHLSKKAKRKLVTTQLQESTLAAYAPGENNKISVSEEVNNEVSIAALECSETFLTVCGRFLKPATHKLFQECLVRECYNYPAYTDGYLLGLLRALEATRKTTPNSVPPTTQYCLHLYSLLLDSRHTEISKFCSQALLDIRLHLHCSPPSLNFALDVLQETEKTTNKRKKVSDRNRAMLESLLGADKLPSADNDDDVISIPDEPSSKKPRLKSDETDQISLSSDSESSVEEVCGDSEYDNVQEVVVVEMDTSNKNNDIEPMIVADEQENEINNEDSSEELETVLIRHETTEEQNTELDNQDMLNQVTELKETSEIVNGKKDDEKEIASIENVIKETEIVKELENDPIYEAQTQLPMNISCDTIEEERPLSLEIGYDFSSKVVENVPVLEKIDDENLPSTNDTDDIQITCGQVVKSSQEVEVEKISTATELKIDIMPKVNGIDEVMIENDVNKTIETVENLKIVEDPSKNDGTTVEDMLADFVDEVNDQPVEA